MRHKNVRLYVLSVFLLITGLRPAFATGSEPSKQTSVQPAQDQISPVVPLDIRMFTLKDCFELALKRSETLAIRKEEIESAEAEILKASGQVLGDVDFLITDFRQDAPRTGSSASSGIERASTAYDRRERKLVISQPLFQGFKSFAALTAAGSLKKQRKAEWKRAEELLFIDVAQAFYDVLYRQRDVETIEAILKSYEERIEELNERERIGRSRPGEVATATSRMQIAKSKLARANGALVVSEYILEFLTGMPVYFSQMQDRAPPESAPKLEIFLESAEKRSDVEAAKQAVKTARSGVINVQSGFWPEITLDSNVYHKREGFQKDIDWDILFKINIPLSRGGENLGNLKQAVSTWKKTKYSYVLSKRQANLEIKQAYQNWHASREEFEALRKAVETSQKNFDFQKEDYARSLVSNLDVLEALEELYNTKRQANEIYYEMKKDYWQLAVAAGVLRELI